MKNYSFICCIGVLALIMNWIVQPAFGIEYAADLLESGNSGGWSGSLKTFDEEWTVNCEDTFYVDVWLKDVPEKIITAGFRIAYDESKVSILGAEAYDGSLPGPWDGDMTNKVANPSGPGTYMAIVGNLASISPDAGDDIPIAKIKFTCASTGDATVTFTPVANFDTIVGNSSTVYDDQIAAKTITITLEQGTASTTTTTTTISSPLEVVYPDRICQSFWFPLPYLLSIKSNDIDFTNNCRIAYQPSGAIFHFPPIWIDKEYLWNVILVVPGLLRDLNEEGGEASFTISCGDEEAVGSLNVTSCGF